MIPWAAPTWQGSSQSADLLRRQKNHTALGERNGKILSTALQSQFWKEMEEKSPWEREGAAVGCGTGAACPGSAAGEPTGAHPSQHCSATADRETQQTARAARGLFLWKVLFLKISSLCILIVDFCCQKTGLVNLSLPPSPFPGELVGREIILYKAT